MIPGSYICAPGHITLNENAPVIELDVYNTGDRPIQVGSHYHFAEVNNALQFAREDARGMRLDIPSGTAVRFEPGQKRKVRLIPFSGDRAVFGFHKKIMGVL